MPRTQDIVLTALFVASIATTAVYYHDNTDRSVRTLRAHKTEMHMLSAKNAYMMHKIEQEYHENVVKEQEVLRKNAESNKNRCLKNSSATGSAKEQLQSFVEGDCAPIIFVPGLMSTKLMVEIDCPTLQEKHPEVMEACGWSTCSWSLFKWRPAAEYMMWMPEFLSPLAFLTLTNNTCFGNIIRLDINSSETLLYNKYKSPEGIKVQWYGNTEGTKKFADGGFAAIKNLMPLPFQASSTVVFDGLDLYFSALGYQKGLSMFAIPYDYRQTLLATDVSYKLERTIKYAYELTGKKVVIACHSLGNLNAHAVLTRMSQEDKDKMIGAYVAITPPFGGASKTVRLAMGGDDSFLFLSQWFGMDFFNQKMMISTSPSAADLIPKDTFYRFRNEPWMKELLKRIEMEKNYTVDSAEGREFWNKTDSKDIPYSFFPTPNSTCFDPVHNRESHCMTGVSDLGSEPIIKIKNYSYYANSTSLKQLFSEHFTMNMLDSIGQMEVDSLSSEVQLLKNPNVPVVYVYGSHLPTELIHEWDYFPEELTSVGKYAFPSKTQNKLGDGTVEVSYALPTALKWAHEHMHNQSDAKPIKIAEYCSQFNRKSKVWDEVNQKGESVMSSTEYMGTECSCQKAKEMACDHAAILNDNNIIELVGNTTVTLEKVADLNLTGAFKISNEYLVELMNELPHLRKSREEQNVRSWLYPGQVGVEKIKTVIE